eukprot:6221957-Prymnesium_polylepis.1
MRVVVTSRHPWYKAGVHNPVVYYKMEKNDDNEFRRIVDSGGEGIMLRKNTAYKAGRTSDMLKYKKFETTEGKVVGYTRGTGQFSSDEFVGSVKFVNRDGRAFKCVPPDRRNPPPIGTIVE